ncbi:Oidioi.mRNA.OKI2018_I69.PAR.g9695.t1.cds [Oikopleura dioica]|uniref:Cilia- and flagella-associated protein 263 n=1 Tax=Oikopleura dioica TaxID=34765 RepID=A0ABN7RR17_OIKDI|nr:Oidioi.mRNA.OKI2018_I69.PAR.g9695.t1.cds [Oikopleura dioica]
MPSGSISGQSFRTSYDLETNASTVFTEVDVDALTTDEILEQVQLMKDDLAFLSKELLFLETFAEKINLDGILPTSEIVERTSSRKKKRGEPKKEKLNFAQKIEITIRLQNDLLGEMQKVEKAHILAKEQIECEMKQLEERLLDIHKHEFEFDRAVTKKMTKDRLEKQDLQIGKLKLKLQSNKENLRRANHSLKSKEESGETMTKIDFDQLEIENTEYQISLDEKNKEMIQAKMKAGRLNDSLLKRKTDLAAALKLQVKLQQRVLSIVSDREKVEKESQLVKKDIEKQREGLRGIRTEMKSYTVPEVYDYIKQSQETDALEKELYEWKRKVAIAEGANKSLRSQLHAAQSPVKKR